MIIQVLNRSMNLIGFSSPLLEHIWFFGKGKYIYRLVNVYDDTYWCNRYEGAVVPGRVARTARRDRCAMLIQLYRGRAGR